ncbi:MAG: GSCFA domain-containing protein [Bacteroidaceae bacterium]|nr:GSCFA domain-containing protein [Bacteroidaceae bacterium]
MLQDPLFRTPVALPARHVSVGVQTHCLFVGSCFAEEVGRRAQTAGVQAAVNPCGTLYNMSSLLGALRRWQTGNTVESGAVFQGTDGLWHSRQHASLCDGQTQDECLSLSCAADRAGTQAFAEADIILVTAGTNRLYRHKQSGQVVANCHKQPAGEYLEQEQSPEEMVAEWSPWLAALPEGKQVVFTVSPYRYVKYGMHGSALSKSALLLAIDALCRMHPNCHYFPAYEIVLDELRDYRFFAPDMLHVSPVAADYVFERFKAWAFTPEMVTFAQEWAELLHRKAHRPRRPGTAAHTHFLEETERLADDFSKKWGRPLTIDH